jgi:hypothetical protein
MATNPWTAEIARVNSVINQTLRNISRDQAYLAAGFFPAGTDAATLREQIASGERFLVDKRAELAIFITEYNNFGKDSTASAGQIVAEAARAKDDGAATSNPTAPSSVLAPTGRINPDNVESGTDAPVKTQVQTQSTPPAGNGSALPYQPDLVGESYAVPGVVTTQAGAAANREDNTVPNGNRTAQIINSRFNQRIVPEPNVLDAYASYTYAITWYLLTPEQYNEMVRSQKKNCASWQLLMQSGGAPTQAAGATANSTATAGRNQFFDLDYYMDDLEIDSLVPLKGTGAANTATDIKFKVTEPNGITLIENLYKAVRNLYKEKNVSKQANYPMAQYCLAVRFYGYNDNGELVTTGRRGTGGETNLTDPKAIVEKFYPFVITNIKFRIPKDRVVEYEVQGKPIPHFYNKSQDRGTIPFAFELTGETVGKVLRGNPVGTVYPASPGERRDSPRPTPSAPSQPAEPTTGAGVDANGNFTGETASPTTVVAP